MTVEDLPIAERFGAGAIWILDSLPQPGDLQTGALLHDHLEPIAISRTPPFPCHRRRVFGNVELSAAFTEVRSKIAGGVFIHLEAHGDSAGLTLQNDDHVSWEAIASATRTS